MSRRVRPEAAQPTFASLLVAPLYYALNLAWTAAMRAIPLLFPMAAVALLVPALALLSLGAGWMVWSSVPTGWRAPLDFQYGDGIPYADTLLPPLVADQAYAITLHLVVSASEANFALGNFMTSIALYTAANRTIASVSKPSIIIPPRTWLRSLSTIPHSVQLLTEVVPTASRLLAHVEVGRKDGWRSLGSGAGREVSIVQAWLVGEVRLSGLRAIIAAFPLTSTLAAMIIFFAFSLGGLLAFAGLAAYMSPRTREPVTATITHDPDFDEHPVVVVKKETIVVSPTTLSEESDESSEFSRGETVLVKSESDDELDTVQLRRRLSRDRVAADPDDT